MRIGDMLSNVFLGKRSPPEVQPPATTQETIDPDCRTVKRDYHHSFMQPGFCTEKKVRPWLGKCLLILLYLRVKSPEKNCTGPWYVHKSSKSLAQNRSESQSAE